MSLAITWCPTTSPRCPKGPSLVGLGTTWAVIKIRVCRNRAPTAPAPIRSSPGNRPIQRPAGMSILARGYAPRTFSRSEEHTSELQSHVQLVCRLLLEKKKKDRPRSQRPLQKKKENKEKKI